MKRTIPLLLACCLLPFVAQGDPAEDKLQGTWRATERGLLIEFHKETDGLWSGKAVEAPRKEELGKQVFRKLRYDAAHSLWTGTLIKPEDDMEFDVDVKLTSEKTLEALAHKFFLSKTLQFNREDKTP